MVGVGDGGRAREDYGLEGPEGRALHAPVTAIGHVAL